MPARVYHVLMVAIAFAALLAGPAVRTKVTKRRGSNERPPTAAVVADQPVAVAPPNMHGAQAGQDAMSVSDVNGSQEQRLACVLTPSYRRGDDMKAYLWQMFSLQTYPLKRLYVLRNAGKTESEADERSFQETLRFWDMHACDFNSGKSTDCCVFFTQTWEEFKQVHLGGKREVMYRRAQSEGCELFAHFDDDDFFHPTWIQRMVGLLDHHGATVVKLGWFPKLQAVRIARDAHADLEADGKSKDEGADDFHSTLSLFRAATRWPLGFGGTMVFKDPKYPGEKQIYGACHTGEDDIFGFNIVAHAWLNLETAEQDQIISGFLRDQGTLISNSSELVDEVALRKLITAVEEGWASSKEVLATAAGRQTYNKKEDWYVGALVLLGVLHNAGRKPMLIVNPCSVEEETLLHIPGFTYTRLGSGVGAGFLNFDTFSGTSAQLGNSLSLLPRQASAGNEFVEMTKENLDLVVGPRTFELLKLYYPEGTLVREWLDMLP